MRIPLFLAALAACMPVHADELVARNKAGGSIVLSDKTSKACDAGENIAFATSPTGNVEFGCWTLLENRVWIKYQDGTLRVHDANTFTLKRSAPTERSTGM